MYQPAPLPSKLSPLWRKILLIIGSVAIIGASIVAGHEIGVGTRNNVASGTSIPGGGSQPPSSGSGGTSSSGGLGSSYAQSIASQISPDLVDIYTEIDFNANEAAGTGIVLSASGIVLTNNHVVTGATKIEAVDLGNQRTYTVTVLGTDASSDVALIQLDGASGLKVAPIGSSSGLTVGQPVVALGNAGGVGGAPSVSSGNVTGLGRNISASNEITGTSETLTGLIEHDSDIQPGDSGGPLVDANGKVIGMNTAASQNSNGFSIQQTGSDAFAIPINAALSIAHQIEAGQGSANVQIGDLAFLGIEVSSTSNTLHGVSGAVVVGVIGGTPASKSGLAADDVITNVDGVAISSSTDLNMEMKKLKPGESVSITCVDQSGTSTTRTIKLAYAPVS